MQCERLLKLAKQWYLHVKEETMAPARMVQFIKQHAATCPVCQEDSDIHDEIERITEIVLPESKIPKAVRMKQEAEETETDDGGEDDDEEDTDEDDDETDDVGFGDDDEEEPLPSEEDR